MISAGLDNVSDEAVSRWRSVSQDMDVYQKDGYEIFFYKDYGFELNIKDLDGDRKPILSLGSDDVCPHSPAYVAIAEYVLDNAETIVSQYDEDNRD